MKSFALIAAMVGAVAAVPAGVTSAIAPDEATPTGCSTSHDGVFEIEVVNISALTNKRSLNARSTPLELTLADGVLTDAEGRTGYIASNNQFQFDDPPQAGAIYTAGWSLCGNGSLALGNSAIFYECLSGTFYNLYDENDAAQCTAILIDAVEEEDDSASVTTAGAVGAVTQISDGQIQATTATPAVVTQISDGQIQATTGVGYVSQISDGQVQATTAVAPVSQISDGQIQATTATAVVSQISDGQIQATTATSVVSAGVYTSSGSNSTLASAATATVSSYTGGAALPSLRAELLGLAAGVLAVAAL